MNLQTYKKILVAKAQELGHRSISKEEIAIERNAEMLDEIQRTGERELALASLTLNWRTAALVKEALTRIEDGSYGTCQECEEEINERRLKALPWAKFCIKCQENADQMHTRVEMSEAA
jgi:DnaK suppressor protein